MARQTDNENTNLARMVGEDVRVVIGDKRHGHTKRAALLSVTVLPDGMRRDEPRGEVELAYELDGGLGGVRTGGIAFNYFVVVGARQRVHRSFTTKRDYSAMLLCISPQ